MITLTLYKERSWNICVTSLFISYQSNTAHRLLQREFEYSIQYQQSSRKQQHQSFSCKDPNLSSMLEMLVFGYKYHIDLYLKYENYVLNLAARAQIRLMS